jgi:hypothetical protein
LTARRKASVPARQPKTAPLLHFPVDRFVLKDQHEEPDEYRIAYVHTDLDAVVEWAFEIFRSMEDGAMHSLADDYVARAAREEGRPEAEIRTELSRDTGHAMERVRRELRTLAREAFEPLTHEAFEMIGEFLVALAVDRVPDAFFLSARQDARDRLRLRTERVLHDWLTVGRPKNQSPSPEKAHEFVRLVGVGRQVFARMRRPVDRDVLSSVEHSITNVLSDLPREREAAKGVLLKVQRRAITGKDLQPKKLALLFAAKLVGVSGGIRSLQRAYDRAVQIAGIG